MNLLSMAQKTPLPAKTVTYADRWNATWFVDLSQFQKKLQVFYFKFKLHFLFLFQLLFPHFSLHFIQVIHYSDSTKYNISRHNGQRLS